MAAVELTGGAELLGLGDGYRITVPERRGSAELYVSAEGRPEEERRAVGAHDDLAAAMERAEMRERAGVLVSVSGRASAPPAQEALAARLGPSVFLEVPQPPRDMGQVVLAIDVLGGISWHVADPTLKRLFDLEPAAAVQLFRVPIRGSATAQFVGVMGRLLLKVLLYPLTDAVLGPISEHYAREWEARNRPYAIRWFTPENYRQPGAPEWQPDDWNRVAAGRALLFIHGGASMASGAFHALPQRTMQTLYDRYEARVFAFNHPTMTADPEENARWFLQRASDAPTLDVDIVCHSRGGIVARELTQRAGDLLPGSRLSVGAVVFVGVPNAGTEIFDVDRLAHLLDRLSSAAKLCPGLPAAEWLDAIIVSVKLLAHGVLAGMPGIKVLVPGTDFLKTLNTPGDVWDLNFAPWYHAIAADYDPPPGGSLFEIVKKQVVNDAVDRVFEKPNDLVVPTDGVGGPVGGPSFPIAEEDCLRFAADRDVMHTTYFKHPDTSEALLRWLEPGAVKAWVDECWWQKVVAYLGEMSRKRAAQEDPLAKVWKLHR